MAERVYLSILTDVDVKRAIRRLAAEQDTNMSSIINRILTREVLADVLELKFAEDTIPNPNEEGRRCG